MFLSCRKEANVKLPDARPLPVMYSYICPTDSVIRLRLLYSSPLYSSNRIDILSAVPDGDVRISGAQGTAQLVFNQNTQYYELSASSYPIVPGQAYKMTVTTAEGNVATAETQVPLTTVPINTITLETVQETFGKSDRAKIYFTDEPGRANYYRLGALYSFVYSWATDTMRQETYTNELYSDLNRDGEEVALDRSFFQFSDSTGFYSAIYYDIFLFNCSRSYYNFHNSLRNYSGDSPFTEPSLVYTNVTGGFGCFGAYTSSRFRHRQK